MKSEQWVNVSHTVKSGNLFKNVRTGELSEYPGGRGISPVVKQAVVEEESNLAFANPALKGATEEYHAEKKSKAGGKKRLLHG